MSNPAREVMDELEEWLRPWSSPAGPGFPCRGRRADEGSPLHLAVGLRLAPRRKRTRASVALVRSDSPPPPRGCGGSTSLDAPLGRAFVSRLDFERARGDCVIASRAASSRPRNVHRAAALGLAAPPVLRASERTSPASTQRRGRGRLASQWLEHAPRPASCALAGIADAGGATTKRPARCGRSDSPLRPCCGRVSGPAQRRPSGAAGVDLPANGWSTRLAPRAAPWRASLTRAARRRSVLRAAGARTRRFGPSGFHPCRFRPCGR